MQGCQAVKEHQNKRIGSFQTKQLFALYAEAQWD